ncbi:MAG: TolC family protein [Myxococcota bacterium]
MLGPTEQHGGKKWIDLSSCLARSTKLLISPEYGLVPYRQKEAFKYMLPIIHALVVSTTLGGSLCDSGEEGSAIERVCDPDGLKFKEALSRALSVSRQIEDADARVESAEANGRSATTQLLPTLTGRLAYDRLSDIDNPPLSAPITAAQETEIRADIDALGDPAAASLWNRQLGSDLAAASFAFPVIQNNTTAEATLFWSLRRNLLGATNRSAAADSRAEGVRYDRDSVRRSVQLNATVAYLSVVVAKGRELIADESVRRSRSVEREVEAQTRSGTALQSDLLRLQAQTARFEGSLAEARNARARTVRVLRTLLQLENGDDIALAVDIDASLTGNMAYDAALEAAFEQREELKQLDSLQDASADSRDALFWEQFPDLEISASLRRARPNPRIIPPLDEFETDWRVGAALSWSPTDFFRARADKQTAEAELSRARIAVEIFRDTLRNEVAQAIESYETSTALQRTATVERKAAAEAYRVRRVQYPAGLTTLSDLIDTEAELIAAELRLLNATVQTVLAEEQLNRAIGNPESI